MLRRHILSSVCLAVLALSTQIAAPSALADTSPVKIGAVGAVNTTATAQLQGAASQPLLVGADIFQNQTVRTDAAGLAEIMFTDQSTITVGHGSEVVLDNFVYDPDNQVGQLAVSLSQGAMRFIGGKISKTNPVRVTTPTATLTIRGGIALFSFPKGQDGLAVFLYGVELTVTGGPDHVTRSVRQPGFGVTVPADGSEPSAPFRVSDQQLAALRLLLESNSNDQGTVPQEPLKPLKKFGSNDSFKPDQVVQDPSNPQDLLQGRPGSSSNSSSSVNLLGTNLGQ
jgi:hypothetical protein